MPLSLPGVFESVHLFAQAPNPIVEIPTAVNLVSTVASLGVLVCFIMVVVKTFQHGQTGMGVTMIVTFFCCVGTFIALIYGWMKADAWRIKNLMIAFTVCLLVNIGINAYYGPVAYRAFMKQFQQQLEQQQQQQQLRQAPPQPVAPAPAKD